MPNGGTPGAVTALAVLPSRISSIVLPPNTVSGGNNFAEIPNGRTLSGSVFLDFNDDGLSNGEDHGVSGQTINLAGTDVNGNAVTRTTTTAADGSYRFTGLPEGHLHRDPAGAAGRHNQRPPRLGWSGWLARFGVALGRSTKLFRFNDYSVSCRLPSKGRALHWAGDIWSIR